MSVSHSAEYWNDMERQVAERVRAGLACNAVERQPTIVFLREAEEAARKEYDRNQTVQIISSGRRLLGDKVNLDKANGRYAYCLGKR
ncbi:hypothetical protein [Methylobacterium thuringiense]|uniref:Uncharacterized protein n=1 Tax=Methylobacterium thuringiense TaxID=1003091 RepID=A0ABQ4TQL3_9HYPH|nr:hypothetical protein [Methylobacterium thuringiense]GJE56957.1 hypothetical protein EKPJFOCH_3467 [Methylobacterium thuringiense]